MYLHVGFFLGHWHTFIQWWQSPPRELPNGSSGATQLFLTATTRPQPCFSVKNTVTYSWWYRLMLTILLMSREIILSTAQTVTTSPRLLGASAASARIVEYSGEQTCETLSLSVSFLFFARQFPRTHHFKVPRAIALHIALTKKSTKTNRHKMIMMTKTTSALSRWSVDWNPSASAKHPDPYVTITAAQKCTLTLTARVTEVWMWTFFREHEQWRMQTPAYI